MTATKSRPPAAPRQEGLTVGLLFNMKRIDPKSTGNDSEAEYDSPKTIDAIAAAIEFHGHRVVRIEATADFPQKLATSGIDLAFNLAEGLRGRAREAVVPAVLDLLGIDFTGSDATTLALALDKALTKQIVRGAGVETAESFVMYTGREKLPKRFKYPLFAKPNAEGSSKGVTADSVIRNQAELEARIPEMAAKYKQGVLVEEFLTGREFTVGILGGPDKPTVLPPMEIVFVDSKGGLPFYDFAHKLDFSPAVRYDTPAKVDRNLGRALARAASKAFSALGCRDVARVDLRLDAKGRVNFIEVNPLPGLTPEWSDLCLIAKGAGLSYEDLIGRILEPAIARVRAKKAALAAAT